MPFNCQPPNSVFTSGDAFPGQACPLPTGNIQMALAVKLWRTSKSASPRSQLRQFLF